MARLGDGYLPEQGPWDHLADNGGVDRRGGPEWHRLEGEGERPELPEAFRVAFGGTVGRDLAPLGNNLPEPATDVGNTLPSIQSAPATRPQPKPTPAGLRAWVRRAIEGLEDKETDQ